MGGVETGAVPNPDYQVLEPHILVHSPMVVVSKTSTRLFAWSAQNNLSPHRITMPYLRPINRGLNMARSICNEIRFDPARRQAVECLSCIFIAEVFFVYQSDYSPPSDTRGGDDRIDCNSTRVGKPNMFGESSTEGLVRPERSVKIRSVILSEKIIRWNTIDNLAKPLPMHKKNKDQEDGRSRGPKERHSG